MYVKVKLVSVTQFLAHTWETKQILIPSSTEAPGSETFDTSCGHKVCEAKIDTTVRFDGTSERQKVVN